MLCGDSSAARSDTLSTRTPSACAIAREGKTSEQLASQFPVWQ